MCPCVRACVCVCVCVCVRACVCMCVHVHMFHTLVSFTRHRTLPCLPRTKCPTHGHLTHSQPQARTDHALVTSRTRYLTHRCLVPPLRCLPGLGRPSPFCPSSPATSSPIQRCVSVYLCVRMPMCVYVRLRVRACMHVTVTPTLLSFDSTATHPRPAL